MPPLESATMWTCMALLVFSGMIRTAFTQTATSLDLITPTTHDSVPPTSFTSPNILTTISENSTTESNSPTSPGNGATEITLFTSGESLQNNGEEGGAMNTAPRGTSAGSANTSVCCSSDGMISEKLSSSASNFSTEITDLFGSGGSEWLWSSLTWKWDIILQLLSATVGILGNLLVMMVIFSRRRLPGRTTDILIGNLAVADFVTSFAIIPYPTPISVPNSWQGMLWCLVMYQNLPLWLPVTASSYILMAMSVERYIAIVYPLQFSSMVTVRRVKIAVGLIWFLAMLSLLFGFFVTGIDETYGYCTLTVKTPQGLKAMGYYWFCLRILVPVATMLITQSLIALELHRQSKNFRGNTFRGETSSTGNSFHAVARNRVLIIMLEIILIYIVCWLPNQVAFLGVIVGFIEWSEYISTPLHRVLTILGFYNSCLNPFIYAAQNPQFRIATKELFTGKTNTNLPVFSGSGNKPESSVRKTGDTSVI